MLPIGSKAPLFTLKDQNGNEHCLSDFIGQKVIIYFYPQGQHTWLHSTGLCLCKFVR